MKNFQKAYERYITAEKKLNELYHQIAVRSGISDSELWVLYCLNDLDSDTPHTQSGIAQKLGIPKQTVNSAVSRLMRDGYIYLEQMAVARNNKRLVLTERGTAFCREYILPIQNAEERAFNRLSEREQEVYFSTGFRHNQFLQEELGALLAAGAGEKEKP